MRILITTGLSANDVGGPFQYGPNLANEFIDLGHEAKVVAYNLEKKLPVGLRHLLFFLRILPQVFKADVVIALDTFSVGVPTVLAAEIFNKKKIVRIGGDFLWETYVNRTGDQITLKQFYKKMHSLNRKEKFILLFTKFLVKGTDALVFNTEWQKSIWIPEYSILDKKTTVIRNFIPPKKESKEPAYMNFLWAGRGSKIKNLEMLKKAGVEIQSLQKGFTLEILDQMPHDELMNRIKNCYAVVHPSLSDVCPNFIIEAISYNKPFIMTQETGLKEIYNKGGIFIDPFDKEELKGAILKLQNPQEYSRYRKELEETQISHSWKKIAEEFISICQ